MSNKQPEFLVKGYHYTEYIEGSDSQKLCIDSMADFDTNSNFYVLRTTLVLPSSYNEKNALKQNNTIEFVTDQMRQKDSPVAWLFYLPDTFKKNSLVHIQRYSGDSIETSNKLSNYFTNYFNNFEFIHNSPLNKTIISSNIVNNNVFIQYNTSTPQNSVPTITYENVTDFTLCLKGIDKFYFKNSIDNKNQFKNIKSLWFVPHQDDEILTLGYGILEDIESGYDVHVILCTDGGGSGILNQWQSGTPCGICHTTHVIHLGTEHVITREEFSKYRDFEFVNCCLHLGVKSENIHILGVGEDKLNLLDLNFQEQNEDIIIYNQDTNDEYYRLKDGGLGANNSDRGTDNAEKIVKGFINKIAPNEQIALRCMHPLNNVGQHKDHTGLGFGVLNVAKEDDYKNNIINLKTFIEYYVYNKGNFPVEIKQKFTKVYNDKYVKKLHDARQCYMKIDWDNGYHGVGYHSVKIYLDPNEKDNLYYIYNGEYN